MTNQTTAPNRGAIVSARGSVIDVRFEQHLPPIYSVLQAGTKQEIVMEVLSQVDANRVRCIALTPTQGLARGMPVSDTGGPLLAPVSKSIVSRMFDVFGRPIDRQPAPVDVQWRRELSKLRWPTKNLPEVIGGNESTQRALIREYLFVSLFRACAESLASENSSRLAAMQRAEKNIGDLLEALTRNFNRQRQTSIDEELFDVISGFEALTGV